MRSLISAALAPLLLLAAAPARADAALVVAAGDYASLPDLPGGARPARATHGLAALGFDVVAVQDGDREATARALARFAAAAAEDGRLVVALSGRFATDGARSWLLTADSAVPTLFGLNSNAVSVESVLAALGRQPSRAVLLLGVEEGEEPVAWDPWISEGLGRLVVPQGVTVLTGSPRAVADFMAEALAEPGGDLAEGVREAGLDAQGYLPPGFRLMPATPAAEPPPTPVAPAAPSAAEAALWRGASALDTVEAYRNYLRVYPEGAYVAQARAAVDAILSEPDRAARLAEESLGLTRDQRRQVQADLATLDFDPRGIDGVWGAGTRAAIVNWQQQAGFAQTSYLDAEQVARLSEQAGEARAAEEARRQAAIAADDAAWRDAGSGDDYEGMLAYLERYPEGRHAEEARGRVAAVQAAVQADEADWLAADRAGTAEAYAAYLARHPDGRHAEEAAEARRRALIAAATEAADPTPGQPGGGRPVVEVEDEAAVAREAALGLTPVTARVVEARLKALGLDPGAVDGTLDARSRAALRTYQESRDLRGTGYLDDATLVRLVADTLGLSLGD